MDDVIYLDSDEEITGVIDKIQQCLSKRVALVVPREATILQSVVNLKLLKKEAESLGKDIALVTSDKIAHNLAGQVGLDVYESIKDSRPVSVFQKSQPESNEVIELDFSEENKKKEKLPSGIRISHFQEEDAPKKKESVFKSEPVPEQDFRPPASKELREPGKIFIPKKFLIATGLLVIISAMLGFLFIPKATLVLTVEGEAFKKDVEITVDKNITQPNPEKSITPGVTLIAEISASKTFKASGTKNEGEKAKGTITIKNYWDSTPKSFSKGTKMVYKSGLVFVTASDATVPGGSSSLVQGVATTQPGTVDVQVEADSPGEDYNVDPGRFSISTVSSTMTAKLFAESTQKFTGGLTKKVTVLSQDDVDKAVSDYLDEVKPNLVTELNKNAQGKKIIDQVIQTSVVESSTDKMVDDETDNFSLTLKVKGETIAFDETVFMGVVVDSAQRMVEQGKKLLVDQTKTSIGNAKMEDGKLKVTITIDGRAVANFIEADLKKQIAGKRTQNAQEILKQNTQIKDVQVKITPPWWLNYLPKMEKNIKFEFKYDSNAAAGN